MARAAALLGLRRLCSSPSPLACSTAPSGRLKGLRIGMTTPQDYSLRLADALRREGATPVACPTIAVERTPALKQDFERIVWGVAADASGLSSFAGIAFVSRSGIAAFAEALQGKKPPVGKCGEEASSDLFLVGALGQDAELVKELGIFDLGKRAKLVVPAEATPAALVDELGDGKGRRLLCPVPLVQGLQEPPVVPDFLERLKSRGWRPLRLNAYATRWLGQSCIDPLLRPPPLDALLFTSTAEVEGLLNSLSVHNKDLRDVLGQRCLLVAYGPVTADGARQLGVQVDLIGDNFNSFVDLVGLLVSHFSHNKRVDSQPGPSILAA